MGHFILCKTCGVKKFINPAANYKYCSRQCREKDPEYRTKLPQRNPKKKIELNCKQCNKTFLVMKCHSSRLFCCFNCSSLYHSGSNHSQWNGGVVWYGSNWKSQRKRARARDNNICQLCGKTKEQNRGLNMDVHHVIPFKMFESYKRANNINNLISLCISCHRKQERKMDLSKKILGV